MYVSSYWRAIYHMHQAVLQVDALHYELPNQVHCARLSRKHATVQSSWATDSNDEPLTLKKQIQRIWPSEKTDVLVDEFVASTLQNIHVNGGSAGASGLLCVAILAAAKLAVPGEIQPPEFTVYQAEDWKHQVSSIMLQLQDLHYAPSRMTLKVSDDHKPSTPWPVVQVMSADEGQPVANIMIAATTAAGIDSLAPRRQTHFDPVALSESDLNPAAANAKITIMRYLVSFHQAASFNIPMDEEETASAWRFLYFYAHVAKGDWAALNAGIVDDKITRAWSDNKEKATDKDRGCAMSALKLVLFSIVNAIQTPVIHAKSTAAALGVSKESLERLMKVMHEVGLVSPGTACNSSWTLATDWSVRPYVKCSVDVLPDWQEQCATIEGILGVHNNQENRWPFRSPLELFANQHSSVKQTYQTGELLGLLLGCSAQQVKATSTHAWRDQAMQGMLRLGWITSDSHGNRTSQTYYVNKARADDDYGWWEATGKYNSQEDLDTLQLLLHGLDKDFPQPRRA